MSESNPPRPSDLPPRQLARARVNAPSAALLFMGIMGLATYLLFVFDPMDRIGIEESTAPNIPIQESSGEETGEVVEESDAVKRLREPRYVVAPEPPEWMKDIPQFAQWTLLLIPVFANLLVMMGAWQMRELGRQRWAKVACVMAILPLSPLFCLSGPFGLWGLLTILRDDVAPHFKTQ